MKKEKPQKASNPSRNPVTATDGEPLESAQTIVKTAPKNHINDSAAATLSMAVTIFSDIRFLSCARYLTAINKQCPLSTPKQSLLCNERYYFILCEWIRKSASFVIS